MPLKIKQIADGDYENILTKWWSDWGWESPSKDFLPQDGLGGIMVYDEDEPICAGFVYVTNSSVSWVDWIISSKTYRKKPQRGDALIMLVDALTAICKSNGAKYSYALIKHGGLTNIYESLGYEVGDSYNKEMIKKL